MHSRFSSLQISVVITLVIAALSGGFFFVTGSHIPKYLIFAASLITIVLAARAKNFSLYFNWTTIRNFFIPWLPWYCSTIILVCFFAGVPAYKEILNSFLLLACLFFALYAKDITREQVMACLGIALLLMTLSINFQVLSAGDVSNDVIGANKNKVLTVASALTVCCIGSLLFDGKTYSRKTKIILVASIISSVAAIILAEVRTAILPFLALIPVVLYLYKGNKTIVFIFVLSAIVLLALSFLTGRMQQGIVDLQNYNHGNANSSWGIRLELWKFVLRGFLDSPFFGWGENPLNAMLETGHTIGIKVTKYYHFHNDFLNWLAIGGLFGIAGWLSTVGLLAKQAFKDPARLFFLVGCLAVGLTEQFWFQRTTLFSCVTIWTLLYISAPVGSGEKSVSDSATTA